jgi:outer membrane protein assembly factor BamA
VRFGRITVVGNSRTRDKVIRREMRIYEGEFYSSSGLRRSKQLIQRLGYFETVELNTSRGAADDLMDVVVEVKEKPTGTFQVGAGFSSAESFIAQAQVAQNNLFGRGQTLSLLRSADGAVTITSTTGNVATVVTANIDSSKCVLRPVAYGACDCDDNCAQVPA